MKENIEKILKEAADSEINMQSEVARAVLTEKLMIEVGNWILSFKTEGEDNG